MELCKAHNIVPFGLLSNATHFLQPCDRFVIAHYKRKFHDAAHLWWIRNNKSRVPKRAIGHLLAAAQEALTPACVKASWADAGLFPLQLDKLQAHPQVLTPVQAVIAPVVVSADTVAAAAAAATAAAALPVDSPLRLIGSNGQVRTSGLVLTSSQVMGAFVVTEQRRADKVSGKSKVKRKLPLDTPAPKRVCAAPVTDVTVPDAEEEKENAPPVAISECDTVSLWAHLQRAALARTAVAPAPRPSSPARPIQASRQSLRQH